MKPWAIFGCTLVLLITFVVFRSRTYSYCVEPSDEHLSIVSNDQTCPANESPIEFQRAWRIQGGAGKLRTLGRMAAKAFVPD